MKRSLLLQCLTWWGVCALLMLYCCALRTWTHLVLFTLGFQDLTSVLCVCVCTLSCVRPSATPWNETCQAPLPTASSRQQYWSRLPFSSAGDLRNPRIEPGSHAFQADSFPFEPPGKPSMLCRLLFPLPSRDSLWSGWKEPLPTLQCV